MLRWIKKAADAATTVVENLRVGQVPTLPLVAGGAQHYDATAAPAVCVAQGTAAAPVSKTYRQPARYVERFDASGPIHTDANPTYGNPWMSPADVIEVRALGAAGHTNPNGQAIRVRAEQQGHAGPNSAITGQTVMAELNPSAGTANYDAFAQNLIASWQNGAQPQNLVGVEIDIINAGGDSDTREPGESATNYTGLWVQQGAAGRIANTGVLVSDSTGSGGWRFGSVMRSRFSEWIGKWTNSHAHGRGLSVTIAYDGNNDREILDLRCGTGTSRMQVRSDGTNPVYVMVGSALKQVTEGPADSAGAGYKALRVRN